MQLPVSAQASVPARVCCYGWHQPKVVALTEAPLQLGASRQEAAGVQLGSPRQGIADN
ncbi:hypothetical protein [Mycobacterium sp.]|uniref:hypothetical protein n=1 Tax=Mycobacterium sp. TaxID=1785 RepID=UPI003D0C3706